MGGDGGKIKASSNTGGFSGGSRGTPGPSGSSRGRGRAAVLDSSDSGGEETPRKSPPRRNGKGSGLPGPGGSGGGAESKDAASLLGGAPGGLLRTALDNNRQKRRSK